MKRLHTLAKAGTCLILLAATTSALGASMKQGEGGSAVQGGTGPGGSTGDDNLARCDRPLAAMAVMEPQDYVMKALSKYELNSPTQIIRMMIQQSNCFIVVERGMAMNNMRQERELMESGQLRGGSNMGGGQMVAADFVLTPSVVFSDDDAGGIGGGIGGAVGGLFGKRAGSVIGGVAGGLKFKEAQTAMLVTDSRSGVQVAAAEGSAKKADLKLGGFLFSGGGGAALGGYGSTAEGKVIAASLVDNFNNIVAVVRGNPSLQRNVGSLADEAAAGGTTIAGAVFNAGDILRPKINSVRLMASPSDGAAEVVSLAKSDELVFLGEEADGFVRVESGKGGGWVKKVLVTD